MPMIAVHQARSCTRPYWFYLSIVGLSQPARPAPTYTTRIPWFSANRRQWPHSMSSGRSNSNFVWKKQSVLFVRCLLPWVKLVALYYVDSIYFRDLYAIFELIIIMNIKIKKIPNYSKALHTFSPFPSCPHSFTVPCPTACSCPSSLSPSPPLPSV